MLLEKYFFSNKSLIIISLTNTWITTAIGIANNKPSGPKRIVNINCAVIVKPGNNLTCLCIIEGVIT